MYTIKNQNDEELATGLSDGELSQYILELSEELHYFGKRNMFKEFGYNGRISEFEDFLYELDFDELLPIVFKHGNDVLTINNDGEDW